MLEGEGLVNDATALVAYRIALGRRRRELLAARRGLGVPLEGARAASPSGSSSAG